ncbi:MAG: DnaJ family molecular chaperone [Hyphomicrobiales bacterium]|nr:DnaJ family molecular chaperone [Hyphomicrobiales bacterium]
MSIWTRIGDIVSRISGTALSNALEMVRTLFAGDPELRRRVAFSVAMIALSAKMAKADGIVTQNEIRAFRQIFLVPENEARNVARLYDIAKQDIAGYETYAERLAAMCGSGYPNCAMLEDILDGLFHIAKADGMVHEREVAFLRRISEIFEISPDHFESILARHADVGEADPYKVLGVGRDQSFEEIRKHYRLLVRENHPDRAIARGLPEEFVAIASNRVAALNTAYETIERGQRRR